MLFTIDHITKTYGKGDSAFVALNDVSLEIPQGDSVAIIGKSGSGKSTLMHLMAALDRPSEGTISFEGKSYEELSQRELNKLRNERFGFIFQQFFLNANQSVVENVALPLKIAGVGKRERERIALETLKTLDLGEKAKSAAGNLSGGQKQRVAIARALVTKPEVIFADEPTGNLDTENGRIVEDTLFRLNHEQGITLVIVTHDEDLAIRCKHQVRIKDGQIEGTKNAPQASAKPSVSKGVKL